MSADFLLTSCPAPLAHITTAFPNNTSCTDLDIAPEHIWASPFRVWLEKTDTINTILRDVDPCTMEGASSWQEFIIDPLTNDDDFADYLTHLDETLTITDEEARTNPYAQRVICKITDTFLEAAHSAFVTYVGQGAIHKWEYVTAGLSIGDVPTDHFDEVALLSWIDFFTDFPIAEITDGTVTGWVYRDGDAATAP